MDNVKNSKGYIIPDAVYSKIHKQKNHMNLLILLNILCADSMEQNNKTIYASNTYLMEKIGWGGNTLIKYKKELEKLKIIKVVKKQLKKDGFKRKQFITLLSMGESDK